MPILPKSYNQILSESVAHLMSKTSINDIQAGSVLSTFFKDESSMQKYNCEKRLITLLSKLDTRFKKYVSPWNDLMIAQRFFSKL